MVYFPVKYVQRSPGFWGQWRSDNVKIIGTVIVNNYGLSLAQKPDSLPKPRSQAVSTIEYFFVTHRNLPQYFVGPTLKYCVFDISPQIAGTITHNQLD